MHTHLPCEGCGEERGMTDSRERICALAVFIIDVTLNH